MKTEASFKSVMTLAIAATFTAVVVPSTTADVIPFDYDGYVAMGGMVSNTTNSYLLPGYPQSPAQGSMSTFGYAFLKCDNADLPAAPVAQASLELEVIALQDGMSWPAEGQTELSVRIANADVASISGSNADDFIASIGDAADAISVTGAGLISLDVTPIVNAWITSGENYGLFLTTPGGLMPRLHSTETTTGAAPVITTIPEPATLGLLSFGVIGLATRRGRRLVRR